MAGEQHRYTYPSTATRPTLDVQRVVEAAREVAERARRGVLLTCDDAEVAAQRAVRDAFESFAEVVARMGGL